MISSTLNTLTTLILMIIVFQDLRYRAIHFLTLLGLFVVSAFNFYLKGIEVSQVIYSYGYLFFCFAFGYLFFVVKKKKVFNPLKSLIGIGDILYFLVVVLYFETFNYVLYFVLSMICSLIISTVVITLSKSKDSQYSIPLAGYAAILFLLLKLFSNAFNFNFFI